MGRVETPLSSGQGAQDLGLSPSELQNITEPETTVEKKSSSRPFAYLPIFSIHSQRSLPYRLLALVTKTAMTFDPGKVTIQKAGKYHATQLSGLLRKSSKSENMPSLKCLIPPDF
jgi:hypothetical protein